MSALQSLIVLYDWTIHHELLDVMPLFACSIMIKHLLWLVGGAPLFLSQRAFDKVTKRKTKVSSYYLDLNLVGDYWGWFDKRFYHHTGMTSNWCALSPVHHSSSPQMIQS